eukprot:GHUV01008306.1.p1 GENE.GHUV01008306.1~~GHUV01008306.1.p1  ORF type:complete len:155 (+),score=46.89 GHUV01008306.1:216-680(+)
MLSAVTRRVVLRRATMSGMQAPVAIQHRQRHVVAAASSEQQAEVQHMSVQDLQELLQNPVLCEEVQFVDVREPGEYQVARLPHFKLMPLSQASSWAPTVAEDMDPQAETVVLCHHGMRSMNTAMYLVSKGFTNVKNVTGGIAAYSMIDRNVPEY